MRKLITACAGVLIVAASAQAQINYIGTGRSVTAVAGTSWPPPGNYDIQQEFAPDSSPWSGLAMAEYLGSALYPGVSQSTGQMQSVFFDNGMTASGSLEASANLVRSRVGPIQCRLYAR
jgi:hypothetical protein